MNDMANPMGRGGASEQVTHAISVDVEDYRQILSAHFGHGPGPVTEAFERNMDTVLATLAETDTKATFFVTGTVAEQRPELVRRWADLGHEIASHGYVHVPIWTMTPEALKDELQRVKRTLEDATGRPIVGYRAPVFSVRWDTLWALDVIAAAGFMYDSSVVPVRMRRYGVAGFERSPRLYGLPSGGEIVEIPLGTSRVLGREILMAGGGYFRLFSTRRIHRAVAEVGREGRPFVIYCHPDEFGQERFRAVDLATGWRNKAIACMIALKSNLGRRKVPRTVRRLLDEFRFSTLSQIAEQAKTRGRKSLLGTT